LRGVPKREHLRRVKGAKVQLSEVEGYPQKHKNGGMYKKKKKREKGHKKKGVEFAVSAVKRRGQFDTHRQNTKESSGRPDLPIKGRKERWSKKKGNKVRIDEFHQETDFETRKVTFPGKSKNRGRKRKRS